MSSSGLYDGMLVWLHDCMTVDILDMFDKLDRIEDMLDVFHMSHRGK